VHGRKPVHSLPRARRASPWRTGGGAGLGRLSEARRYSVLARAGCTRWALNALAASVAPWCRPSGLAAILRATHSLRLVCLACGARDWEAKVFLRAGAAEASLEGLTVSPIGGGPAF
jgi:hypothetical protein